MKVRKGISYIIISMTLLLLMNSVIAGSTIINIPKNNENLIIETKNQNEFKTMIDNPVNILLLLDNNYGANYHYIRDIFEGYGWNITTTALTESVTPCDFQSATRIETVDILLTEITDLTQFDCLSIMPGATHDTILNSNFALDKIGEAVESNLVVTAWCRAVRILAKADLIDGLNVTGHADYISEYEAAGATYLGTVPPVTQGNIITSIRSQFYRAATCTAIARAIYDDHNSPELENYTIEPKSGTCETNFQVTAVINEESVISILSARFFEVNEDNERVSSFSTESETLDYISENTYSANVSAQFLENGYYEVEIYALDICGNNCTYILEIISIGMEQKETSGWTLTTWLIISGIFIYFRKKKIVK